MFISKRRIESVVVVVSLWSVATWTVAADEIARAPDPDQQATSRGLLLSRLTITDIPVTAAIDRGVGQDNPSSFWDGKPLRPVIFVPQPNGGAKIGWTDTEGKTHITPIDAESRRCGPDMIFKSGLLRDLVAHDDGSAVLMLQNGGMYLTRIRDKETMYSKRLISNHSRDIHMGSLAWNGDIYAAYFAVHGGGHEGDALRYVSKDGEVLKGGWTWGCSHSIDMRVVAVGKRFMPLALSDAYPGTGLFFHHNKKRVSYTWGDRSGGTGGRIGGIVPLGGKMFVAFSSKQGGRKHWGAALADFTQQAPHDQSVHKYLQKDAADQLNVKIARYGDDKLLLSWRERGQSARKFQLYNADAKPLGDAEALPVQAPARADPKTCPAGDVVWAHTWGEDQQTLKVVKIRYEKDS